MKFFKMIFHLFKNLFKSKRKKEIEKRNDIYDDVSGTLSKLLIEKSKNQEILIQEIKDNWRRLSGQHYGSKFIPGKHTNSQDVLQALNKEYFFRMEALDIYLTKNLELRCK